MRRRIFFATFGAILGVLAATMLNESWGLDPTAALAVGGAVGMALGYVASMLFDVFTSEPHSNDLISRD